MKETYANGGGYILIFFLFFVDKKESLREKCPYSELLWFTFPLIRTEYGEILRVFSNFSKNLFLRFEKNQVLHFDL